MDPNSLGARAGVKEGSVMPIAACRFPALLVILSLLFSQMPQGAWAQTPPLTPGQLDQLLAPIALYPDALLAQITTASTNPQEILDVANWLASNPGLRDDQISDAAQQQGFDPAFVALVHFPTVLQMMAENIDDYAAIGQAVAGDQAAVSASIQRLRAQAYAAGALRTTPQQTVVVQQGPQPIYVIQPANPQVVYVPQYNPTVVYVSPSPGAVLATSLIGFSIGIGIGALIADNRPWGWSGWGWNWYGRGIYYNHGPWGGWHGGYRPPHYWYRPQPIPWYKRPGYGGNWHYRPPNYRPPVPVNRPRPVHPGYGNRPVYDRLPQRPVTRPPQDRPPQNRPPNAIPVQPNRPGPARPSQPGEPSTRPAPNPAPRPPMQPAPSQAPQPQRPPSGAQPSRPSPPPNTATPPAQPRPAPPNNAPRPTSKPAPQARSAQPEQQSGSAGRSSGGGQGNSGRPNPQ